MNFKSNLEEKVYQALKATGSFTSGFSCIKEQSWKKLFPNIKNTNAIDFYYPLLNLIIEVQGEQHYMPVSFCQTEAAIELNNFRNQKLRDKELKNLCEEYEYYLLEVHYQDIREKSVKELSSFLQDEILNLIGDE